ncbi:MAG: hypothetical protein R3C02_22135 [Planctomycetaceae bacterium]
MMDRPSYAHVCLSLLLAAIELFAVGSLRADDDLSRYFAGLRQRGLYRVAESDCLRRLADDHLAPGERARLAIELSRTYAEHATYSAGEERDELWDQAEQVIQDSLDSGTSPSDRVWLEAQHAINLASKGAQLRWQVELSPLDRRTADNAADILKHAIEQLRPLPEKLEEQMRAVSELSPAEATEERSGPLPSQLREMRQAVEFRTAVATLDLAKVLSTGPDRAAAFLDAETRLKELVKTPKPDEHAWLAEVMLIQLLRLQGDFERVEPRVVALLDKESPSAIRDAAVAELVRTQLDQQRPDAAIASLKEHRGEKGWTSEELKCLVVETLLAARRVAIDKGQTELVGELMKQAETYAAEVDGAWGTRCRVQIETARESDLYGPKLASLIQQAKWAWKNGDIDEAMTFYRQATAEAHRTGRGEFAVEFGLTLATLQTESGKLDGAADTLTGLLKSYPESDRAADADLLRAYVLGKQFEGQPDDSHRHAYREALTKHRTDYPGSPTSAEAAWMLARLDEHERDWPAAIAMLKSIPADSKRWAAASARIAVIYEQLLRDLQQRGEPTETVEQQATEDLSSLVEQFDGSASQFKSARAMITLQLARLLLKRQPPEFEQAERLLEPIVTSREIVETTETGVSPEVLANALQLQVISFAGQGRIHDARDVLNRLAVEQPDRMLAVLNGLTGAAEQVAIHHRQAVSKLQLELSQKLEAKRDTLSVDTQIQLDESLAQSYAAIGQVPKAAALYEKLIWQQPKNLEIVKSLALLYESCGTPGCLRNALPQWEKLEHQQNKGTVDWLESRYHLAWCNHRLGDDETARKLVGVTQVLYPELGNPELKEKFRQLSSELKE